MARRRFFVPEVRRGLAQLTGEDAEHLVRVLRAQAGDVYEISDDKDLYLAEVELARKSIVSFKVLERLEAPRPGVTIWLVAALFKFDRFEWMVEKATELGVAKIQPFEAQRTEHGLAQAAGKRLARWKRIAVEASQQSRRVHLPAILPTVQFKKALQVEAQVRLLLDETPAVQSIVHCLPERREQTDSVALMAGPEGGWTNEERELALAAGWASCSLGNTVLRAETAALAGLAVIGASWAAITNRPDASSS